MGCLQPAHQQRQQACDIGMSLLLQVVLILCKVKQCAWTLGGQAAMDMSAAENPPHSDTAPAMQDPFARATAGASARLLPNAPAE